MRMAKVRYANRDTANPGHWRHPKTASSVAELRTTTAYVLLELGPDCVIQRRLLVVSQRLGAYIAGPGCRVLAAELQPALVVRGRREQRPVEALPEPLHGVLCAEEVAAVADLLVRAEGQRCLVDLQRREFHPQHAQQLDVDDELLVARDQPALEPAGRVHDPVRAGEKRRQQRHQRLVRRLGVACLAGVQAAAGPERQAEVAGELTGAQQSDAGLGRAEAGRA